jgi:hypothetical protein
VCKTRDRRIEPLLLVEQFGEQGKGFAGGDHVNTRRGRSVSPP